MYLKGVGLTRQAPGSERASTISYIHSTLILLVVGLEYMVINLELSVCYNYTWTTLLSPSANYSLQEVSTLSLSITLSLFVGLEKKKKRMESLSSSV